MVPLVVFLLAIGSAVVLLLSLVTCCAVRCFRPQNSRGAEWYISKTGKDQTVQAPFSNQRDDGNLSESWLRQSEKS